MRDHPYMRPADYDDIDESTIEVHEGHAVTIVLSVPLQHDDFAALSDVAERDGKTVLDAAQDAVRAYVAAATRRVAS
jgi:hypothetical protein